MVTAYLFDRRHGRKVGSWVGTVAGLDKNEVLWIDVENPSEDELRDLRDTLDVDENALLETDDPDGKARLKQHDAYLRITAVGVSDTETDPDRESVIVDCFVGSNWVVTAHSAGIAALDDFREIAEGEGEIGSLDPLSFLSTVLEWVVTTYLRAFDEIEATLEEFDVDALTRPTNNPEERIAMLVDARRRVGRLRRKLAPHRELFSALSHSEFDPISTEHSAERFAELTTKVDNALATARDAKDGIASSFDVLIVRTEHRTNQIIKVLTIASVLLLPGTLIAGVAGMNVNLNPHTFVTSSLFWGVLIAIGVIAISTLAFARQRRWI
jgi:magnesium transporter